VKNAPAGAEHTFKAASALRVEFLSAMRCIWTEEEKKKEDKGKISVERVCTRPYSEHLGSASILPVSHSPTLLAIGHGSAGERVQAVYVVSSPLASSCRNLYHNISSSPALLCTDPPYSGAHPRNHLVCPPPHPFSTFPICHRKFPRPQIYLDHTRPPHCAPHP